MTIPFSPDRWKREKLADRIERGDGRYVFVTRPRCPACGSPDLHTYKTIQGNDSTTRYSQCKCCQSKFLVVLE